MQLKLPQRAMTERETRAAVALARAILPTTATFAGADESTVRKTEEFLGRLLPESVAPWGKAQAALAKAAIAFSGKSLDQLSPSEAEALVAKWAEHPVMGKLVNPIASVYKITHFDRQDINDYLKPKLEVVQNIEQPRWLSQIERAETLELDEPLECDVIVIGTGAGGAVVGRHLAEQGHAVVFLEEGEHVRRNEFPGNFMAALEHFYRNLFTLGNTPLLIPQGRLVGGSTAVNGGSSFRPPRWVTDRWCEELGSDEFSSENLERYFEKTESILEVTKADPKFMGPIHDIFVRGADKLGWHHEIIRRNAPGCQGRGFCDNGCRTDARRSTNLSYIPQALERGAFLVTGCRAERLILENGRTAGVEGVALGRDRAPILLPDGSVKRVTVRAKTVILAGGAFASPSFLLKQGIGNSSDQVGRNMTFHPSGPVLGLFDEAINGADYIPQADYSFEFINQGILLLSASPDRHMTPPLLPFLGRRLMGLLEKTDYLGGVGYLIVDSQKGRLRLGPGGTPLVTYNLSKSDIARAQRAIAHCAELLFAAGAKEVYPGLHKPITLRDPASLERFRSTPLKASELLATSYHPLGSCKMSPDPRKGVVDLNHQSHDVPGLFIVDGSTISGPLGVNPQITIMGFATRAAEKIGALIA